MGHVQTQGSIVDFAGVGDSDQADLRNVLRIWLVLCTCVVIAGWGSSPFFRGHQVQKLIILLCLGLPSVTKGGSATLCKLFRPITIFWKSFNNGARVSA